MTESSQKIFNQFHSSGSHADLSQSELQAQLKHIASTYDWNYREFLPSDKGAKILDLGCGLGAFLSWLKEQDYQNFQGADVSQQMLDLCRQNVTDKVEKISSIKEFLMSKNNSYDLIALNDVIEHLPKTEIIEDLEIIKAALKPGGKLLIKTNNLAAITGPRLRYDDFTHEVGLTENSLRQILRIAGFNQIEIRPFGMPLVSLSRYIRYGLQQILNTCWKFKFWINFTPVPKIVDEMIMAVGTK